MLDLSHIPKNQRGDTQIFTGNSITTGEAWHVWQKPRGKTMCNMILIGGGGNGGISTVGAATAVAGAGGGSSGAVTIVTIPLSLLPDRLYISLRASDLSSTNILNLISISPDTTQNNRVVYARSGNVGGNNTGATVGAGGTAAVAAVVTDMPIGWSFLTLALAGGTGGTAGGGAQANGGALTIPTTGVFVCGGSGGAGIDSATGTAGQAGGAYTITAGADFPAHPGGVGGTAATVPPTDGCNGYQLPGKFYFYGGTGGGGTYNAATGTGLKQGRGGHGSYGCGGGGMGSAITGSTPAEQARGGPGLAIITCW